jgi:hippurate hydrolase
VLIGNHDPEHGSALHHPLYDFNDSILAIGTRYWIRLVETLLPA